MPLESNDPTLAIVIDRLSLITLRMEEDRVENRQSFKELRNDFTVGLKAVDDKVDIVSGRVSAALNKGRGGIMVATAIAGVITWAAGLWGAIGDAVAGWIG